MVRKLLRKDDLNSGITVKIWGVKLNIVWQFGYIASEGGRRNMSNILRILVCASFLLSACGPKISVSPTPIISIGNQTLLPNITFNYDSTVILSPDGTGKVSFNMPLQSDVPYLLAITTPSASGQGSANSCVSSISNNTVSLDAACLAGISSPSLMLNIKSGSNNYPIFVDMNYINPTPMPPTPTPTAPPLELTLSACKAAKEAHNAMLTTIYFFPGRDLDWVIERGDVSDCYMHGGLGETSLFSSLKDAVYAHFLQQNSKVVGRDANSNPLGPESLNDGAALIYMKKGSPTVKGAWTPELRESDVGIIWDSATVKPLLTPCYLHNNKNPNLSNIKNHRGDIIEFLTLSQTVVLSPVSGTVEDLSFISKRVGWEMTIASNYSQDWKQVYVDLVHSDGPLEGIAVGTQVSLGQPILYLNHPSYPGNGAFIDATIRNRPKVNVPNDPPVGYWSFLSMLKDDLALLPPNSYIQGATCRGEQSLTP